MRRSIFVSLVAVAGLFAGCGPEWAVVPRDGLDRVVGQSNGVTMVAFENQWAGDPYDLANYVTPIAVELYNGSPYEVRVNYADFALRDQSGTRFPAINPYYTANGYSAADAPISDSDGKVVMLASNGPILLASHSGGGHSSGGGFHGGGYHGSAIRSGGAPRGYVGAGGRWVGAAPGPRGWGIHGGAWHGFRPVVGTRRWYGYGVGYWGGPWAYPPYYWTWVYGWGPLYYPSGPSEDVLELGLPEGVLPPGARVSGFLYFKKATGPGQGGLDLAWEAHDAQTGAALAGVHLPLEVMHR
jgi:hypothetical protein